MSKMKKIVTALCLAGVGAVALWGTQWVMHKTNTPEFCVSCHSMSYPKEEWEGSSHFANAKGGEHNVQIVIFQKKVGIMSKLNLLL